MKIGARPTDNQIIAAMSKYRQSNPTYVIRNILAEKEFGQFDDLNTSHVLYRLNKLQRKGLVRRVSSSFYPWFEWEATVTVEG